MMAEFSNKPLRYLLQAINYTVFMALVWYFATLALDQDHRR
jgi:hypothetical protein